MNFEEEFPYPSHCQHHNTEIRKRIFVNGTVNFGVQCTDCGGHAGKTTWMKRADAPADAPMWDEGLSQRVWDRWNAAEAEKKAAARREWLKRHDRYLMTPKWAALREKVIRRENGVCQGCADARGVHVHHMTYDRWGNELLTDLTLFCKSCHERYHAPPVDRTDRAAGPPQLERLLDELRPWDHE